MAAVVRGVLVVVAAVFFTVGWLTFQPWHAMTWLWAAMVVGFTQAQESARSSDGGG